MSRVQEAVTAVRAYLDAHTAVFPGSDEIVSVLQAVPPQPGQPATKVITLSKQDLVALTEFADLMIQSRARPEVPDPDPDKVHRSRGAGLIKPLCGRAVPGLVVASDAELDAVDCPDCLAIMQKIAQTHGV